MLLFAERAQALGHDVRVAAPCDFEEDARKLSVPFTSVGGPVKPYLARIANELHHGGLGFIREANRYSREAMAVQYRMIPELGAGCDLIVSVGIQFGARVATTLHRTKYLCILYCPAVLPSAEHAPFTVPYQRMPRFLNRLMWAGTRGYYNRTFGPEIRKYNAPLNIDTPRDAFRYLSGDHVVLAADEVLAPAPIHGELGVTQVSAFVGTNRTPLPDRVRAFLDAGPPPVYVGFGSMPDPDATKTARAVMEAARLANVRLILGSGWANVRGERDDANVLHVDTVSHAELFPKCAAIVHHGGAGTTTTAFRAGVPQIVVPHTLDQFYFARRVEDLNIGPSSLPKKNLSAQSLAERLRLAISTSPIREAAASLAAVPRLSLDESVGIALDQGRRL